jgi:extracellular factor (EF) 3-hydroxypalmitic acid methyl ester biosynthesis protein
MNYNSGSLSPPKKPVPARVSLPMNSHAPNGSATILDALIVCENSRGVEIHGTLLRLARHEVSFEIYAASENVQLSEVLADFKIIVREQPIYSGRAVITSLVNAGPVLICQANLQDSWLEVDVLNLSRQPGQLPAAFAGLINGWEKIYRIAPEYKVVIADIQSFLFELRHWVQEVETGLSGAGNGSRLEAESGAVAELVKPVTPCLNHLFEKFELASGNILTEMQPAHGIYAKRQLHPLLLCAPFMHRIYRKPLGYAGDYEMVNMMLRDPSEGSSLFAKVLNAWFLSQVPAEAHRNRIKFLSQRLKEETIRVHGLNRSARCYSLGCGPAQEVRDFMEHTDWSNHTEFTLLDFNEETLDYTRQTLEHTRQRRNRATRVQLVKKSVAQVIKAGMRSITAEYDFVYCAGLFDYLPDRVAHQLMNMFYAMLQPGGLLLVTNVDASNPIRNIMGYIFEWRLIERTAEQMRALIPNHASADDCRITSDPTACNVFLEVRKPKSIT